jgi:hypothetical protein
MWREIRADRLEAQVLTDLFAAGEIGDPAEAEAAKSAAFKALGTLLRYRGRIEREHRQAMEALDALRQHRLAPTPARPPERESAPAPAAPAPSAISAAPAATPPEPAAIPLQAVAPLPSEPERPLNRHQRRALAAMSRRRAA